MIDFKSVKGLVTAREAAKHYGLTVNRYGMALCPFHDDHKPSMKLDEHFHCFGCGEVSSTQVSIDFSAKYDKIGTGDGASEISIYSIS